MIRTLFKRWRCQLFHDHEVVEMSLPDRFYFFGVEQVKGCKRCNLWKFIDKK